MTDADAPPPHRRPGRRRLARLAAAQALYQAEINGDPPEVVLNQFVRFRLGEELDGIKLDADKDFFTRLVRGVDANLDAIDPAITAVLAREGGLGGLALVLRAVLRLGAYELLREFDVPPRVTIHEYSNLAGDFFGEAQAKFATAVFDRIARTARPDEIDGPSH